MKGQKKNMDWFKRPDQSGSCRGETEIKYEVCVTEEYIRRISVNIRRESLKLKRQGRWTLRQKEV